MANNLPSNIEKESIETIVADDIKRNEIEAALNKDKVMVVDETKDIGLV